MRGTGTSVYGSVGAKSFLPFLFWGRQDNNKKKKTKLKEKITRKWKVIGGKTSQGEARRSEALVVDRSTSFRHRVFDDDEQEHQSVCERERSIKSFSTGADDDVVASISLSPYVAATAAKTH